MASILRLASKDRSSFLFKRSSQQNTDSSQNSLAYDPDNDQLPNISHIDTASLFNLFDRYNTLEFSQSTTARDFAWPIDSGTKSAPSLLYQASPTNLATPTVSKTDTSMANMGRNDSTGSSTLSMRSDSTPPMTRHSSSSSVMPAISPLALKKSRVTTEITALPDITKGESTSPTHFRTQRQVRANTWDSTTSSGSQSLNLDKPLPLGPPGQSNKYSNSSARRKHKRVDSLDSATLFRSADKSVESPTRFESLRRHSRSTTVSIPLNGQNLAKVPASPAPTSRGARLGKAIAQANTGAHLRSKSESLLESIDNTKHRPTRSSASVDLTKLAPKHHPLQKNARKALSARTAEQVIYRIMCQLQTPRDLQSAAMVSKGFLHTYQRNESNLVSHMVFQNSRPAWELRRSLVTLKGSRTFKMRDYLRDLRTIQAMKAFIAERCRTSCKAKTMAGLLGQDKDCEREVETALWRVWTFCALFGDNASQNPIPTAELDWLNGSKGANSRVLGAGFAVGNGTGLTVDELEDMSEIWCCLQTLVSQFHGREAEAERAGVFENWHVNQGFSTHQHVTEWTAYILTLGPQVILSLSSGSFDQAKILGLTKWTPPARGQSRAGFLTTAISQVYQERLLAEATAKAAQITLPSPRGHRPSKSLPEPSLLLPSEPAATLQFKQPSLRIDTQTIHLTKRRPVSTSATVRASSPHFEIRPDCDPANDNLQPHTAHPRIPHTRSISTSAITPSTTFFPASPTADPTIYHSLNLMAPAHTASVKLGATLFPMEYTPATPRVPFLSSPPPPPTRAAPPPPIPAPGVKDPIDKAMDLLVKDLGFKENNAKRALAMCDSGSGIDVERAIELLIIESRREAMANATRAPIELPTPADIVSPLTTLSSSTRRTKSRKDYCEGDCRRATTSGGSSLASVRGSVIKSRAGTVRSHAPTRRYGNPLGEENAVEETGNISPITDIYGGHSDNEGEEESIPDDSSEMWRRREGSDTISPLMTPLPFRGSPGQLQLPGQRKAWKVLGLPGQQDHPGSKSAAGLKGGLARMRSKSSGHAPTVVGMEEYALRVERKRSLRLVQAAEKERNTGQGRGLGVVSAGLGESLRGLTGNAGPAERMSGGLGGFREMVPASALGLGLGGSIETEAPVGSEIGRDVQKEKEGERERSWGLKRGFSRKDVGMGCLPQSPC